LKIFAIFEMNTLATVYCCAGEVKMCMAAVKGENNQWKICFENQANFFFTNHTNVVF